MRYHGLHVAREPAIPPRVARAAALLWPPRVRAPIAALFTFFADVSTRMTLAERSPSGLDDLDERLARLAAERPPERAVDREVQAVLRRYAIPLALLERARDAHAWDVDGRRYATLASLEDYLVRRWGTLAAAIAAVLGARKAVTVARACDLAIGLGLVFVAREIGRDARRGRVYLPLEWLEEAGVDADAWLAAPLPSAGLSAVGARALSAADGCFLRADPGIAALPFDCRPAARAWRYLGAGLGHALEQGGFDPGAAPVTLGELRGLRLCVRALRPARAEARTGEASIGSAARPILEALGTSDA